MCIWFAAEREDRRAFGVQGAGGLHPAGAQLRGASGGQGGGRRCTAGARPRHQDGEG